MCKHRPCEEVSVTEANVGARVFQLAASSFHGVKSTSAAKKLVKSGGILVNGEAVESSRCARAGDVLSLSPDAQAAAALVIAAEAKFAGDTPKALAQAAASKRAAARKVQVCPTVHSCFVDRNPQTPTRCFGQRASRGALATVYAYSAE